MKISNLRFETGDRARIAAKISWEDCSQPDREVYFETLAEHHDFLNVSYIPFLVGALIPAMYYREKRIQFDENIDPQLYEGLVSNMMFYQHWYGKEYHLVRIEAKKNINYKLKYLKREAGQFLSGGVDSLYALRRNMLNYDPAHPWRVKNGILVHGFDIYHDEKSPQSLDIFDRAMNAAAPIAQEAGIRLIPVYTNIRHLHSHYEFWMEWFFGAALSSVAHSLSNRLDKMIVASGYDISELCPWGSDPLIDPNYGSSELIIKHDINRSRLEKIQLLSEWDVARNNVRVCVHNHRSRLNCSECEKCLRTMLYFMITGKLKECRAFEYQEVTPKLLSGIRLSGRNDYRANYYFEMIPYLKEIGRNDLVKVLEKELGLIGNIKRFDRDGSGSIDTGIH